MLVVDSVVNFKGSTGTLHVPAYESDRLKVTYYKAVTIISLIGLYGQCLIPTRTSYALSGVRELISRNTRIDRKSAKSGEHGRWLFSVRAVRRFYHYRGKALPIHFYFAVYLKFSLLTYSTNSTCNRISESNLNVFVFVKILESDSAIPVLSFISIFQI